MDHTRRDLLRTGAKLGMVGSIAGNLSTTTGAAAAQNDTVIGNHTINTRRLNTDQTRYRFLKMTDGRSWQRRSGGINLVAHGAGYNLNGPGGRDLATCAATADAGWGSWTGVGRVGTWFKVKGREPARVTINTYGQYNGLLSVGGSSGAAGRGWLILKDQTSGASWRRTLFSESYGRIAFDRIESPYNTAFNARLVPGHRYMMWAEIRVRVEVTGLGLAGADFGPEDGDDADMGPPNGVELGDFGIWPRRRWNRR